jgi:hypothetical protein
MIICWLVHANNMGIDPLEFSLLLTQGIVEKKTGLLSIVLYMAVLKQNHLQRLMECHFLQPRVNSCHKKEG